MRRWPVAVLVPPALIVLAGGPPSGCAGSFTPCDRDSDCPAGRACVRGVCTEVDADAGDEGDAGADGDAACPPGRVDCFGACVDLAFEHDHCGSCGHACDPTEVCNEGLCVDACPAGRTPCGGGCRDTATDVEHCGTCDHTCPGGLHADPVCASGVCRTVCHAGWSDADGDGDCESSTSCVAETCNGVDDDCDTACDNGFACCRGSSLSCSTSCGTTGTAECTASCAPGTCTPPDEACNGIDDDCDGTTDEDCPSDCYRWSGSPSLPDALAAHDCVEIQDGTFALDAGFYVPGGRELRGLGRDRSVLVPSAAFDPGSAMVVAAASDILLRRFRVRGDQGARAALTVVVVGAGTRNVVIEEMEIDGARCDGVSMGGDGTVLRASLLHNNGYDCPPVGTGSAVYGEGISINPEGAQHAHAPQILDNTIEDNPLGSGIDMAGVSEGRIAGNTIRRNGANGGIAIYQGYGWTIEDNDVSESGGWVNPGHPRCEPPHSPATAGIKLCCDQDIYGGTNDNVIRNNRSTGYYGILLIGNDEAAPYLVPRFNQLSGNDVMGSTIGCYDDFAPGQWMDGDNVWSDNNCRGTADTPPDYF